MIYFCLFRTLAASAISIANSIAPGQGETLVEMAGLKNVVDTQSSLATPVSNDQMIAHLANIYKALEEQQYPFIERIQLLALLPENMGNQEIVEKFGCSMWEKRLIQKYILLNFLSFWFFCF